MNPSSPRKPVTVQDMEDRRDIITNLFETHMLPEVRETMACDYKFFATWIGDKLKGNTRFTGSVGKLLAAKSLIEVENDSKIFQSWDRILNPRTLSAVLFDVEYLTPTSLVSWPDPIFNASNTGGQSLHTSGANPEKPIYLPLNTAPQAGDIIIGQSGEISSEDGVTTIPRNTAELQNLRRYTICGNQGLCHDQGRSRDISFNDVGNIMMPILLSTSIDIPSTYGGKESPRVPAKDIRQSLSLTKIRTRLPSDRN
ncbi:hypothetical protein BDD12DRAFT_803656 [Trichophaea hybrida]|nr:hypothetical protein BDD12DRAFT_803656 [Trichophaea hybrida]